MGKFHMQGNATNPAALNPCLEEKPWIDPFYLTPPDYVDPVIEVYKKDVDRSLLRENLKLTTEERSRRFERFMACVYELRRGMRRRADDKKAT